MSKLIRRYLIPALIAALAGTGVSFAATGSVVPFQHDTTQVSNNQDDTTEVESEDTDDQTEEIADQNEDGTTDEQEQADTETTPKARSTQGCPEGFTGNHGQFVAQSEDHHAAAHSDCGKPINAVDKSQKQGDDNEGPGVEENEENEQENESTEDSNEQDDQDEHGGQQSNQHGPEEDESD